MVMGVSTVGGEALRTTPSNPSIATVGWTCHVARTVSMERRGGATATWRSLPLSPPHRIRGSQWDPSTWHDPCPDRTAENRCASERADPTVHVRPPGSSHRSSGAFPPNPTVRTTCGKGADPRRTCVRRIHTRPSSARDPTWSEATATWAGHGGGGHGQADRT